MLVENKVKRRKKTKHAILFNASCNIREYLYDNNWGPHMYSILRGVWQTAFQRGYDKALRDMVKDDISASAELALLKRGKK